MAEPSAITPLFDLSGKTACVTGASAGLGRRAATVLAGAGANVVGIARRAEALNDWVSTTGGRAAAIAWDLTDRASLPELASRVAGLNGPPDIIVHAAGINTREQADEVSAEGWDTTLNLNLATPFFLSQAFVPAMKKQGWGRIVNFASLQSSRAFPGGLSYGASKGGIAQLTRAMAEAWSPHGINANAIGPGFFPTELTEAVFADPDRLARNAAQTCIGRNGEMQDIDGPLLFLCSEASAYVTGQVLMVDGGFTAK
ncbi:SDR family oxidoreductase [Rhodophyticola sp. CCM32]|uniref:SDR family NAD(P)-dependent oxidoreductase n=1 Tax=Rhodophyticola sp. CCM32 TaxID=2916397 RepID=UPI00107F58E1|nr:SDR family oxidoreductase [Rhodophyticola sp. CCM32]QBY01400.1 SDR family oxidoreductase [Rhodophyticola sp. CCM32]